MKQQQTTLSSAAAQRALRGVHTGVIYGGPSGERAVSMQSGAAIASALEQGGHRVMRLPVANAADAARKLDRAAIDVAFIALHGTFGEDGGIQTLLQERALPYTGCGVSASRLCMDKAETKRTLASLGLPTPPWAVVTSIHTQDHVHDEAERLGYPVVVKPNRSGSSLGVSIVTAPARLTAALAKAFRHDTTALIEAAVTGSELTVGILDGNPLPVVQIVSDRSFFDYDAKYRDQHTRYLCPAPLDRATREAARGIAEMIFQLLQCRDLARIDMLLPAGSRLPQVIDVNTIPGFTDHSLFPKAAQAAGIGFTDLCRRIAAAALARAECPWDSLRKAG